MVPKFFVTQNRIINAALSYSLDPTKKTASYLSIVTFYDFFCESLITNTVHYLKLSHFFPKKKTAKKCDNLGTFTQNILFSVYNKTKRQKAGQFGV